MKYIITSILFFITVSCFAVSQKLTEVNKQYISAELNISKIESEITGTKQELEKAIWNLGWEENKTGDFRLESIIKNYRTEVEEKRNALNNLYMQQAQTKELLQRLKPLKKKYDEQLEEEHRIMALEARIENITLILLVVIGFVLFFVLIIKRNYKLYQMMEEGKLTKEEYEKLMRSSGVSQAQSDSDNAFKTYNVRNGWWS